MEDPPTDIPTHTDNMIDDFESFWGEENKLNYEKIKLKM